MKRVAVLLLLTLGFGAALAQTPAQKIAQTAVTERIDRDTNARDARARYLDCNEMVRSDNTVYVAGSGIFHRDLNDRGRNFSFSCVVNLKSGDVTNINYRWGSGSLPGDNTKPSPDKKPSVNVVKLAEADVKQQILLDYGRNTIVKFRKNTTDRVNSNEDRVRGQGTFRDRYDQSRNFDYDVTVNRYTGKISRSRYTLSR